MPFHLHEDFDKKINLNSNSAPQMEPLKLLSAIESIIPALNKDIFKLQKRSPKDYYFLPIAKDCSLVPKPDGVFYFVIPCEDKHSVYCGLKRCNSEIKQKDICYISGPASITKGANVYMAGELILKQGMLQSWNKRCFQYLPKDTHVITNLLPSVKMLLPIDLYEPLYYKKTSII